MQNVVLLELLQIDKIEETILFILIFFIHTNV